MDVQWITKSISKWMPNPFPGGVAEADRVYMLSAASYKKKYKKTYTKGMGFGLRAYELRRLRLILAVYCQCMIARRAVN